MGGPEQVGSLPEVNEDGTLNYAAAFFTISYVLINVWTILQVVLQLGGSWYQASGLVFHMSTV